MNDLFGRRRYFCVYCLAVAVEGHGGWALRDTGDTLTEDEALDYDLHAWGYAMAWDVVCHAVTSDDPEERSEGKALLRDLELWTGTVLIITPESMWS
jgi:hypothetical protein